jgi:hypothetical protein
MGIILLTLLLLLLLGVLWGPSLLALRKNEIPIASKRVIGLLSIQLIIVALLVSIAEAVGLLNPGGLILVSVILVSAAGYLVARTFGESDS